MKLGLGVLTLGLVAVGTTMAAIAGGGPPAQNTDIFLYTLHLPSVTGGVEDDTTFTDYEFSFLGPEMFNAAPNTACPSVCGPVVPGSTVTAGEQFAGFAFTSSGSDGEVEVLFSDFSGDNFADSNTVTFELAESDAFWATPGSVAFPTDGSASFVIGTAPESSQLGEILSSDTSGPITCNQCSLDIQDTPEPNTSALFAGALGGLALLLRKRLLKA